jgi:hypothetical protein
MYKEVTAKLETNYKITVGHNGCCMGHYDPSDEWYESYYGTNLRDIAELMSSIYYDYFPKEFRLEQMEILIYEDCKYDHRLLGEYNQYSKDQILKSERDTFFEYWKEFEPMRKKLTEIKKEQEERAKKLAEIEYKKKQEQKELEEYQKLKEKYEK